MFCPKVMQDNRYPEPSAVLMRGSKRRHSSNLRTLTFFDYLFFLLGFDAEAQSSAEIASWSGSTRLTTDTSKSAPISGSCFSSGCFFACCRERRLWVE